jgi:hypothetical protein
MPVSILDIANLLKVKCVFIPKRPGEPDITHKDIKKIKNIYNGKQNFLLKQALIYSFKI